MLGSPVAHSLSPALHTAGYAAAGLTGWSYTAIECAEVELPGLVAGLGPEWAGLSLTMPLKEVALTGDRGGARQTLAPPTPWSGWPTAGGAENTDAPGMMSALALVPRWAVVVLAGPPGRRWGRSRGWGRGR